MLVVDRNGVDEEQHSKDDPDDWPAVIECLSASFHAVGQEMPLRVWRDTRRPGEMKRKVKAKREHGK
jgi:hypothetical protein